MEIVTSPADGIKTVAGIPKTEQKEIDSLTSMGRLGGALPADAPEVPNRDWLIMASLVGVEKEASVHIDYRAVKRIHDKLQSPVKTGINKVMKDLGFQDYRNRLVATPAGTMYTEHWIGDMPKCKEIQAGAVAAELALCDQFHTRLLAYVQEKLAGMPDVQKQIKKGKNDTFLCHLSTHFDNRHTYSVLTFTVV